MFGYSHALSVTYKLMYFNKSLMVLTFACVSCTLYLVWYLERR